jgi:hypothetical protein
LVRPEFPGLAARLYNPLRLTGNLIWKIAGFQNWTHYFMPTGHDRGCPNHYEPLETCLCWGGVDLRTKQMSPEGRFYLKSHLAIWLFGVRWYDFWKNTYYAWNHFENWVERQLVPSRWACEYCSAPWGKHDASCSLLEQEPLFDELEAYYDNWEDPMYEHADTPSLLDIQKEER